MPIVDTPLWALWDQLCSKVFLKEGGYCELERGGQRLPLQGSFSTRQWLCTEHTQGQRSRSPLLTAWLPLRQMLTLSRASGRQCRYGQGVPYVSTPAKTAGEGAWGGQGDNFPALCHLLQYSSGMADDEGPGKDPTQPGSCRQ